MYLFKQYRKNPMGFSNPIYIPLCIYLNVSHRRLRRIVSHIYIPLCIYLNRQPPEITAHRQPHLHSTMYLFKLWYLNFAGKFDLIYIPLCIYLNLRFPSRNTHTLRYLHSTMYLFKLFCWFWLWGIEWNLHSTMYLFKRFYSILYS